MPLMGPSRLGREEALKKGSGLLGAASGGVRETVGRCARRGALEGRTCRAEVVICVLVARGTLSVNVEEWLFVDVLLVVDDRLDDY